MIYFILVPLAFLLSLLLALNAALPASILWGWFVAPLGLPQLGVAHAAGLIFAINSLRPKYKKGMEDEKPEKIVANIFGLLAAPWFALAAGWVFV